PNCKQELETVIQPAGDKQTTSEPPHPDHSPKKQANKKKISFVVIPILVVIAFFIGFFASDSFDNMDEEEAAIEMAKTFALNYYTSRTFVEVHELNMEFSNVEAELVQEETDSAPGSYEVTGEFIYDEEKHTFTVPITFHEGMYFPEEEVTIED